MISSAQSMCNRTILRPKLKRPGKKEREVSETLIKLMSSCHSFTHLTSFPFLFFPPPSPLFFALNSRSFASYTSTYTVQPLKSRGGNGTYTTEQSFPSMTRLCILSKNELIARGLALPFPSAPSIAAVAKRFTIFSISE